MRTEIWTNGNGDSVIEAQHIYVSDSKRNEYKIYLNQCGEICIRSMDGEINPQKASEKCTIIYTK